jgi:HK97 family phage prohead protease
MSIKTRKAVADAVQATGEVVAMVSPFGGPPDLQGDVIAESAYTQDIAYWNASRNRLPVLISHDWEEPTANIGHVERLEAVQDYGLVAYIKLDLSNERARYVHKLLAERRMVEFSIGYDVLPGGQEKQRDGSTLLTRLHLIEISIVLKGAAATAGARDARTELLSVKAAPAIPTATVTEDGRTRCSNCGKFSAIAQRPTTVFGGDRVFIGMCSGCGALQGYSPKSWSPSKRADALREIRGRAVWNILAAVRGAPADIFRSAMSSARYCLDDPDGYTVKEFADRVKDLIDGVTDDTITEPAPPMQKSAQERELFAALDALDNVGAKRRHPVPNEADRVYLEDHLRRFHGSQVKPASLVRMNLRELQATHRVCHPEFPFDSTESVNPDVSTVDAPKALSPAAQKFLAEFDAAERHTKVTTDAERQEHERWEAHQHALLSGPIDWVAQAEREAERQKRDLEEIERRSVERDAERVQVEAADDARRAANWRQTGAVDYTVESIGVTEQPVDRPRRTYPEPIVHDGTVQGLGESIGALQTGYVNEEDLRLIRQAHPDRPVWTPYGDLVVDEPIPDKSIPGEGETVRVNTAQRANENRRIEKEKT